MLFSIMAESIYMPINKVRVFPFPHPSPAFTMCTFFEVKG